MLSSEKDLIRGLKTGDARAFERFVCQYGPRIYNLHCWICGDRTAAEDLTQETVIAVFRDICKFRGESSLYTWVHRIARNIALQYRRRHSREGVRLGDACELESPDDIDESARREFLRNRVREALELLPAAQRETVTLHYLHGLTYIEVARTLGRPLGSVKWQIAQGLHGLRSALLEVGVDPDEL